MKSMECVIIGLVGLSALFADDKPMPTGPAKPTSTVCRTAFADCIGSYVLVPQDEGGSRLIPVEVTLQPYRVSCPTGQSREIKEIPFRLLRVWSALPETPFSFTAAWPNAERATHPPGGVVSICSSVSEGCSYITWSWGSKWLYIAEMRTGNAEDDVVNTFLKRLSEWPPRQDRKWPPDFDMEPGDHRSGKASSTEALPPHEYPGFGIPGSLLGAADLERLLGAQALNSWFQLAWGASFVKMQSVRRIPDGRLGIWFWDLAEERLFVAAGSGTQWTPGTCWRVQPFAWPNTPTKTQVSQPTGDEKTLPTLDDLFGGEPPPEKGN
jgi:hypothetical protein